MKEFAINKAAEILIDRPELENNIEELQEVCICLEPFYDDQQIKAFCECDADDPVQIILEIDSFAIELIKKMDYPNQINMIKKFNVFYRACACIVIKDEMSEILSRKEEMELDER